jgi:hypothetical protein
VAGSYQSVAPHGNPLLALLAKMKYSEQNLKGTNALAYSMAVSAMNKKDFYKISWSGPNDNKLFPSTLKWWQNKLYCLSLLS